LLEPFCQGGTIARMADAAVAVHARERGGVRQRMNAAMAPTADIPSHLAGKLMNEWAWGHTSANRLQEYAQAACDDGLQHVAVQRLARLGTHGRNPQNCHRELLNFMKPYMKEVPKPVRAGIHLLQTKGSHDMQVAELDFMPAHVWNGYIHDKFPEEWVKHVIGEPGEIEAFWAHVMSQPDDPKWKAWGPTLMAKQGFPAKAIPYTLHEDAVPVFKKSSMHVQSSCPMLGSGSTLDRKQFMGAYWDTLRIKKSEEHEFDTEGESWKIHAWGIEAWFSGVHPPHDHEHQPWTRGTDGFNMKGTPIAGGYFGVPWHARADLDALATHLGMEHTSSHHICHCCPVSRPRAGMPENMLWTYFKPDMLWKQMLWCNNDAGWREHHPNCHVMFNTLCMGPNTCNMPDTTHVVNLGVAQHVSANVMHLLVYHKWILNENMGNVENRTRSLWGMIQEHYQVVKAKTQLNKLVTSMWTDPSKPHQVYPELKAKAKETEHVCQAMLWIWKQEKNDSDHDGMVTMMLEGLCMFFDLCHKPGHFMSAQDADQMLQAITRCLLAYTWLGENYSQGGYMMFNMTPKFHYWWHIGDQAKFMHPRHGWTLMDEDFVGRMAIIGKKSACGVKIALMSNNVLLKWLRGKYMMMSCRLPDGCDFLRAP